MFLVLLSVAAAELIFVAEVSRHGARSPTKLYDFNKEHWDENMLGELTSVGMRQHFLIGKELSSRYVKQLSLLSESLDSTQIYARSTDYNRTLQSAYSQLSGLYPPKTGPKIPQRSYFLPPMKVSSFNEYDEELGGAAIIDLIQPVPIHSEKSKNDHLLHGYDKDACPRIAQIEESLRNSVTFTNKEQQWASFFKQVKDTLKVKGEVDIDIASNIETAITCGMYDGLAIPEGVTEEMYVELCKVHAFKKFFLPFSDSEAQKLSCSEFFKEISWRMQDAQAGKGVKFAYYSAHDTTLAAFLTCLSVPQSLNPPFASTLVFQLHSDNTVEVLYNDQAMKLPDCSSANCSFSEFNGILKGYFLEDIQTACQLKN